jgi:cytosine deaminase
VDTSDPSLLAVDALLEVKRQVAPYIDLQLVAFPQDGVLRSPGGIDNLKRALDKGVDVVGGIPHFERTMADGAASVKLLMRACGRARQAGRHALRRIGRSALAPHRNAVRRNLRLGLQGRVTGSHCTSMHSMDNYYVSKLLPLIAQSGVSVVSPTR